jgi:SEC-C motif-containing protein
MPFPECCGRYIQGDHSPPTAEALMRSRYSAFVELNADYLLSTWHPDTRPSRVRLDADLRWLGLKIKAVDGGGEDDEQGTVEFVARCKRDGRAQRLHEISRFDRIDDHWYYREGEHRT